METTKEFKFGLALGPWNQIEDADIDPHTYEHLIFDNEAKLVCWNKCFQAVSIPSNLVFLIPLFLDLLCLRTGL